MRKQPSYFKGRRCKECNKDLSIGHHGCKCYDKDMNWTGEWFCKQCYNRYYQKNYPLSGHNIIKQMAKSRMGNLKLDTARAIGNIFEAITCKVRGVKSLNLENDDFRCPIDHSSDPELGIGNTAD